MLEGHAMTEPLNWGIISTARIAGAFAAGVARSSEARVVAVGSRAAATAEAFAARYGIPRAYGSYEALLADAEVDAVYIGLPNHMHAEWSIRAAQAGKHVLCEKPMGANLAEVAAMFEAARAAKVWMMEAFMYRFHPRTLKLQELLAAGAIGAPRLVRASFGFTIGNRGDIRLKPEMAGGALMDVGCYPVNFARMVVGAAPTHATAAAVWDESGVDGTLAGTLEYPGGALGQVSCSFFSAGHQTAQIIGTAGVIDVPEPFSPPGDQPALLRLSRGGEREEFRFEPVNQYQLEAEGFGRLIRAGHGGPEMPLIETLENTATIDALLLSARENQRVPVARV
jgi:predicted dehydrogenase